MSEEKLLEIHSTILEGVVAYVDVWFDAFYNHSELWETKLKDMGAKGSCFYSFFIVKQRSAGLLSHRYTTRNNDQDGRTSQ